MNTNELEEFKIKQIERNKKDIKIVGVAAFLQLAGAGFFAASAIMTPNPVSFNLFAMACAGTVIPAILYLKQLKEMKEDNKKIASLKTEADFEEYKVKRIEICKRKVDSAQKIDDRNTAIALSNALVALSFSLCDAFQFVAPFEVLSLIGLNASIQASIIKDHYQNELNRLTFKEEKAYTKTKELNRGY